MALHTRYYMHLAILGRYPASNEVPSLLVKLDYYKLNAKWMFSVITYYAVLQLSKASWHIATDGMSRLAVLQTNK